MVDEKATPEEYRSSRYDDPSAKLWSAYLSKAEKYDRALVQNWKGDMDSILIFAGLFSASLTAFIVESYKTLSADPNDVTAFLLLQISQQLSAMSNSTMASSSPLLASIGTTNPSNFIPSNNSLICNSLWFLSLAFSLMCALTATLVESWSRHFLLAGHNRPVPQDRARISAYLYHGIQKYGMAAIVEVIPMLLHVSLFLFFTGLVFFLLPVNPTISYLMLSILAFCCILYALVTFLPISCLDCPYWTPISSMWWHLLRRLNLLWHRDMNGDKLLILCSMQEAREIVATEITAKRDERDLKAMCWTLRGLREDSEFEPFVEVIPNVVSGIDYSAKLLMHNLLHHGDISIRLGYRIPRLLGTCSDGFLDRSIAPNRAITCLKAIWSLTMLSIPQDVSRSLSLQEPQPRFNEDTLHLMAIIRKDLPCVKDIASSAITVVARSLIDTYIELVRVLEEQLTDFIQAESHRSTVDFEIPSPKFTSWHKDQLENIKRSISLLGDRVTKPDYKIATPYPLISMKAIIQQYSRLMPMTLISSRERPDQTFIQDMLNSLHVFQNTLNEAGFSIALHYISEILSSASLPHEASNTLRRTFFRLNLMEPISQPLQSRLIVRLDEALEYDPAEGATRLPQSIVDILLNLTRILDDPSCISKASTAIAQYLKFISNDSALQTLSFLREKLPLHKRPLPPLDLYSCHLYTDAKAVKTSHITRSTSLPTR